MSEFAPHFMAAVSILCGLAVLLGISALRLRTNAAVRVLVTAKAAMLLGAALSVVVLNLFIGRFIADDFSIAVVSQRSAANLPFIYKVSAVWASAPGWLLLLSVGTILCFGLWLVTLKTDGSLFNAVVFITGGAICLAFSAVAVFTAKPFARVLTTPSGGRGLDPLLQNFWMTIHPPAIILAYSAFLVPFVVVTASVFAGSTKAPELYMRVRRWLLIGIGLLGLGIVSGARWAYLEPDWGGYWMWDPMQNLSLVVWLSAVVALHSLNGIVLADSFRRWAMLLVPAPFVLCMLLGYVEMSGILKSTHSFGDGLFSSVFLAIGGACLFIWLISALGVAGSVTVAPTPQGKFRMSKANVLFATGVGFVVTGVVIAVATMLPAIIRIFTTGGLGWVVTVSFYEYLISAAGILLAFMVGLYRLIDLLQRPDGSKLPVMTSSAAGILCLGILYRVAEKSFLLSLACGVCLFSAVAVLIKFLVDVRAGKKIAGDMAHLGVVMLVVAAGLAHDSKGIRMVLDTGKKVVLSGWEFVYDSFETSSADGVEKAGPQISARKGQVELVLWPHRDTYAGTPPKTKSRVAVNTRLFEDVYISFEHREPDGGVVVTANVRPYMFWLWLGCAAIVTGSVLAVFEGRPRVQRAGNEQEKARGQT